MKRTLLTAFAAVLALTACSKGDGSGGGTGGDPGDKLVEITFAAQGSTRATTPGSSGEQLIEQLDLLIFHGDEFSYRKSATRTGDRTFTTSLKVENGLTVHFIANSRSILDAKSSVLAEGNSWLDDIRPALIDDNPARLVPSTGSSLLPSWAMLTGLNVEDKPVNQWSGITMMRSVASVDITVAVDASRFDINSARLYFAPDMGLLAPLEANISREDDRIVSTNPEAPASMVTDLMLLANRDEQSANLITNKLYLYENDAAGIAEGKRYTRLVIGGFFNGSETETFYPVDFKSGTAYEQIKRNWKYQINVTAVNGPGLTDPDDASTAQSPDMVINMVEWEVWPDMDYGNDGTNYISIERKNIYVARDAGSTDNIALTSNLKSEFITLNFVTTSPNGPESQIDNGVENTRFKVEKIVDGNDYIQSLRVTAVGTYNSTAGMEYQNKDTVIVTNGPILFKVAIEQLDRDPSDWNYGGEDDMDFGEAPAEP